MTEIIAIIANLALTFSLIVAVIFGIAQVKADARDRKERLTLETLRNFQTREFAELINYINTRDMPETRKAMNTLSSEEQIMFIQYAQQMESLGILVAEKFINLDLVDKTLGSFVTTSWEKYELVFLDIRKKAPDPYLGEYFQWLSQRIDERMKKNPRKAFFET